MAFESMTKPYNERLLNERTFRGRLHLARYFWLEDELKRLHLKNISVLELGCFDGKAINYIDHPVKYAGYDANWENGLDIAKELWKNEPSYSFYECYKPAEFNPAKEKFDITVCQEVLEHLRSDDLKEYIEILAASTKQYCFVSVPNESGLFFLSKFILKKITQGEDETYSLKEILNTTFGRINKVERSEHGHKGFDYKALIILLSEYFEIVDIKGIPFSWLPKSLNFSIALVLKPRP